MGPWSIQWETQTSLTVQMSVYRHTTFLIFLNVDVHVIIYKTQGRQYDGHNTSLGYRKPGPHAAMLHTCDGVFQKSCDAQNLHAMCCECDLLSDYQTVFTIVMSI